MFTLDLEVVTTIFKMFFTGRNSFTRHRHMPYSTTFGDSTLEVSVLLLTNPLMVGHFAGNSLPRSCVFPELLQTFDETNYTCLASRLTSLSEANIDEVLDVYNVTDEKKRSIMVRFATFLDCRCIGLGFHDNSVLATILCWSWRLSM